ncbi:MAG: Uma2 family endonuclease [Kofleriaceae bacterium]|nr:MAG: Uma2 family endonuclease [Kofleriaceae bacterium]MBZ0234773.1 Uma2 family endonuclease [Kofleriaceae bacterium]
MVAIPRTPATLDDLIARGDTDRLEIVGGHVVEKAMPSPAHAQTEAKLAAAFDPYNRKPGGRGGPGGWWLFTEIHVSYPNGEIYCHDAAGWRRDRVPERPNEWPVRVRPDWVGEIVSPRHEKDDLVTKPRTLLAAEVPHYWVLDPEETVLLVHRWSRDGYIVVLRAAAGEVVRAEPFDGIELDVATLFGIEDDE